MVKISILFAALLPLYFAVVQGENDWSKPCYDGMCTYRFGASAYMSISGSPKAISDISEASGWKILGCDPGSSSAQSIRLVCASGNMSAGGCGHLFEGGVEHTIVRLPESCSKGPFARASRMAISSNQFIEDEVLAARLKKRSGAASTVHSLDFDFDFASIPPQNETISFVISGNHLPTAPEPVTRTRQARSLDIMRRDIYDNTTAVPPFNYTTGFNLLNASVACPQIGNVPATNVTVTLNAEATINAQIGYGYYINGTLVPTKVEEYYMNATATGNSTVNYNIAAAAGGEYDTGHIQIITIPIPGGLVIPGVLDIGPMFTLHSQAIFAIAGAARVTIGSTWTLDNSVLDFPPNSTNSNATSSPAQAPLKVALAQIDAFSGRVEAHLVPRLAFGVDIFNHDASATLFLEMDTSSELDFPWRTEGTGGGVKARAAAADLEGCIDLSGQVAVNIGAEGKIPNIYEAEAKLNIYTFKHRIFNKCFGGPTKRSEIPVWRAHPRSFAPHALEKRQLPLCEVNGQNLLDLIDQVV